MGKTIYEEETDVLLEKVKNLLENAASYEFYSMWADTFTIKQISEKNIIVYYHGEEPFKEFKKECKKMLWMCICSALGGRKNIKLLEEKEPKVINQKLRKNIKAIQFLAIGMVFACISAVIITVLCNYIGNRNFRESFYNVSSLKVDNHIRVVQISDLHSATYGKDNKKLTDRIEKLKPDLIICTGDIIDSSDNDDEDVIKLCQKISKIAPSYYIYGNNEVERVYDIPLNQKELDKKFGFNNDNRDENKLLQIKDSFEEKLGKTGINVLKNKKDTLTVGTTTVDIYGVLTSNPSSFWSYSEKSFLGYIYENEDNLKITAIHEPYIFEEFEPDFWGDLMVCGHTHGGEIRVPVLGPLYTREGGLFPERKGSFVYGRYDTAGRPLIVSSGLENKNISRINNQPELVIIDINKF